MSTTPVLDTIRALLKFKDHTTISEIAKIGGFKAAHVLDVVNRNGAYVHRFRSNGKIAKVDLHEPLRKQLWQSGRFYKITSYGEWSTEGEEIVLRDGITVEHLSSKMLHYRSRPAIVNTVENRRILEDAGLLLWSETILDDQLWQE